MSNVHKKIKTAGNNIIKNTTNIHKPNKPLIQITEIPNHNIHLIYKEKALKQ